MSRLIWILTVCKCMSEFTRCLKLPDFILLNETSDHCVIRSSEKASVAVTIEARGNKHTHTGERGMSHLMT